MIEIRLDYYNHEISINGHAGSAEYGHDLVCAAASILAITVQRALKAIPDIKSEAEIENGNAHIIWEDSKGCGLPTLIVASIAEGFQFLAEEYPENLTLYLNKPKET